MNSVPTPQAHGGDGANVARALGLDPDHMLDLSLSLNPVALDPAPIVASHLGAIGRYPDPTAAREALASAMGVESDRLLLTNGGAEAIALVAAHVGGSVHEPEFSLHPRGTGPRWRSNPHSPTGLLAGSSERAAVWDEAFYPLATGRWTRGDDDSIVVGSLTKVLACPGLRIGYVLGEPSFIQRCRERQPMWSLNGLGASALPELLARLDIASDCAAIRELRENLRTMLVHHGLTVLPSDANWVLVWCPNLREVLAPRGVLVRDCANFGLDGFSRIAVPNARGLDVLDRALDTLGPWIEQATHRPVVSSEPPSNKREE